jgi:alpha-beta hydrolase superfamily lysophospholipase
MFTHRTLLIKPIGLLFILSFFISCGKDDTEKPFEPDYFVSAEHKRTFSLDEVRAFVIASDDLPSEATVFLKYGVDQYRITYRTVGVNGESIVASGALVVPRTDYRMPVLSFQHGTITNPDDAPGYFLSSYTEIATAFASVGYIMALPDYIGYGSTAHLDHPYEHRNSLATATRDMLRAVYEYFKVESLPEPDNKLFLSGYSEGGLATMAAAKLMQEEHQDEFNITAVTVGAGAYNKSAFADYVVLATESLPHINTFVWVLDAYNSIYPDLQRPYSAYFNEPWATTIANEGPQAGIESNPSLLFTEGFIQGMADRTDTAMWQALADNDCYDWRPGFPIQLYHGTHDLLVPYFNSETAYAAMQAQGAPNLSLQTIPGGTHTSAVLFYSLGTLAFFQSYR